MEAESPRVYHVRMRMCAYYRTHICVHITRLRTHEITDRSYLHPVGLLRTPQEGAKGCVWTIREEHCNGPRDQDSPCPTCKYLLDRQPRLTQPHL